MIGGDSIQREYCSDPDKYVLTIKKEENKKEVLETFEKEEISNHLLDANKHVPRYNFLQEFCTINGELKDNESVSKGDNWFSISQREFLLEPNDTFEVKRYHSDFHSYFSIDTSNSLDQKGKGRDVTKRASSW